MSACGLVALVTPLLMWASMSFGLFTLLITVWCLALFILGLMVMTSPDDHF